MVDITNAFSGDTMVGKDQSCYVAFSGAIIVGKEQSNYINPTL